MYSKYVQGKTKVQFFLLNTTSQILRLKLSHLTSHHLKKEAKHNSELPKKGIRKKKSLAIERVGGLGNTTKELAGSHTGRQAGVEARLRLLWRRGNEKSSFSSSHLELSNAEMRFSADSPRSVWMCHQLQRITRARTARLSSTTTLSVQIHVYKP